MTTPTFEQMVQIFIFCSSDHIYDEWVVNLTRNVSVGQLRKEKKSFKNFPSARYATDVTFRQYNRPSALMQEGKGFFSGKHKL